jgi:hypothetical protein
MLTPPRPSRITALRNLLRLFPEGAPVTAPDRCVAGQLDPWSMLVLSLSGEREAAATRQHRQPAAGATCRLTFIDSVGGRVAGLGLPTAFQPAISIEPMTSEHRGWRPALTCFRRAAKPRQVVIAGHDGSTRPRRNAPCPNQPEFCESFEHRPLPLPLCAAGQ